MRQDKEVEKVKRLKGSKIMFTFFAVLTVVGLIGVIISCIMLIVETEHFALWVALICVCGVMFFVGAVSGAILSEEYKDLIDPIIQEEQVEDIYQYKYCPYCGKEIR